MDSASKLLGLSLLSNNIREIGLARIGIRYIEKHDIL